MQVGTVRNEVNNFLNFLDTFQVGKESPAPPPSPSPADAKTTPACKPKKTSRSSTSASRPHDSPKKKGLGRISLKMGKSLSSATLPEPTELNDDAKVRAPSQMSDTNSSDQTIVLKMEIKIDETDFFQASLRFNSFKSS